MVSWPARLRTNVDFMASRGAIVLMSKPEVSWLGRYWVHLLDELRVVGAVLVQPEDSRLPGEPRAGYAEPDPVLDGRVLGLAHAENIVGFDALLHQGRAVGIDHTDCPVAPEP